MAISLAGRALAPGTAAAEAIVLDEPLSLWGGLDPASGEVIEPRHPQRGVSLTGRVVVMMEVRGSSSSSSVLAEAARAGVAPAGFLLGSPDLILAIGSAVADELYRVQIPVLVLDRTDLAVLRTGARVTISADGAVRVD
jgi:predicted aconitase with swiveling domain